MKIVCGCDIGSRTGKILCLKDGQVLTSSIVPVSRDPGETAERALKTALENTGIARGDIAYTIGTGYGKAHIPFAQEMISEIGCHGKGAHWVNPRVRTVIDIGGQDCKVILLNEQGEVENFAMNDKCAAGTGLFLENIAEVLGLQVEALGEISRQSTEEVKITNQCSVFALSEVISLVALKVTVPDIVAGIHSGVANRVISMVHRLGMMEEVMVSGGVSKNPGVVRAIGQKLGVKIPSFEIDHQLFGALGAALYAQEAVTQK